ncbi:hydroxyphenylacetyl-CoA thioesterase PaaI [Crenobacter luteus]|uniref:Thioesterase domain-containing protein n=1 Tax=Crenobacter luteus TaxID=1452487 RepID=A0A161SBM0_9NEIS|nr:hydroxyphenylacetyl-CoA thioesterase PaaI [Crenobacter luteus]KZE27322.1 hypothetical protein AVW16_01880 [Crenobacter luteus]
MRDTLDSQALAEAAVGRMLANDRASARLGMRLLEVRPGYARIAMTVTEAMLNGFSICHGGMIFALADTAFAAGCNSWGPVAVGAGTTMDFLKSGQVGDELVAVCECVSQSGRTGLYDVTVRNQHGEVVAVMRGRSYRVGNNKTQDQAG